MQRDISSNVLARLQRLQDMYSQFFDVSIRVVEREGLKSFTVTSNGSPFCIESEESSPDICRSFHERMISASSERTTVTSCPFGCLFAVSPLGTSLETGLHAKIDHFLVVYKAPALTSGSGEDDGQSDVDSILGAFRAVDASEQEEFLKKVQVISSAFDLVIGLLRDERPTSKGLVAEKDASRISKLTKRELEIARLVSTGMTNQQIADQLFLSEHTVKLHISNILRKLDLSNRTQLAIYGVQYL